MGLYLGNYILNYIYIMSTDFIINGNNFFSSNDGVIDKVDYNTPINQVSSLTVLGTVTGISFSAFAKCSNLSSVDFSGATALQTIGRQAFYQCTSLSSVNFSGVVALTSIDEEAFRECSSLSSVIFPATIETISRGAFSGCTSLNEINLSDTALTIIDDEVFQQCSSLSSIIFSAP